MRYASLTNSVVYSGNLILYLRFISLLLNKTTIVKDCIIFDKVKVDTYMLGTRVSILYGENIG
jgi:hypothetical protein